MVPDEGLTEAERMRDEMTTTFSTRGTIYLLGFLTILLLALPRFAPLCAGEAIYRERT